MAIKRIWIEPGCISCNLCDDLAPAAFEVPAGEECRVRKGWEASVKGDPALEAKIQEAADSCPVDVIKLAVTSQSASDRAS
jgi:ferredoxin